MSGTTTSRSTYLWTGAGLFVLLGATIVASRFQLGPWSVLIALAIASAKAALVALFFMHIRFDKPLVRLFAGAGLLWLIMLLGLTFADVATRGWLRPDAWLSG